MFLSLVVYIVMSVEIPAPDATLMLEREAVKPVKQAHAPMGVWDRLAECESNGDWQINTGNTFYGGIQFNKSSWDWAVEVGGHDVPAWPHHATREQQITVGETLLKIHPLGWGAWPSCASQLGLY